MQRLPLTVFWVLVSCLAAIPVAANTADNAFFSQINGAMNTMMQKMSVRPSGDVDKDFVATMIPHHEGAMEMAEAELRYGHNPQLTRIAQEIIVTQQQEILAMRLALGQKLPPSVPAPDQTPRAMERRF